MTNKTYTVGTLSYTRKSLASLFYWLLWGDFCYILMEQVMPQLLPLFLDRFNVSSAFIAILVITMPEVINFVLNPIISTISDRTRSRWGRRRPYLLFSAPFVGIFLALLGWSAQIGRFFHDSMLSGVLSVNSVVLIIATILVFFYKIFDIFCTAVLYYIFNDVVPHRLIGIFMALFRMVGIVAIFIFQRYLMRFADGYMPWLFTGVALLYVAGMTMMCLMVKEGEYPPINEDEKNKGIIFQLKLYFKECYSMPFYVWFFTGVALNTVSTSCRGAFNVLFATKELGLSIGDFGLAMSYYSLVVFILMLPAGYLADKIHPLLMYIVGGFLISLVNVFGFFIVNSYNTFLVMTILLAVVYVMHTASYLPMHVAILPQSKYGQFCSAGVMIRSLLMILTSGFSGWFLDLMGLYRYLYVWDLVFTMLGTFCLLVAYVKWRKLGGAKGYVPPIPGHSAA